jgi:hypothetical protein
MSETGTGTPPGSIQSTQDVFEQMLAADEGENEQLGAEATDEGEEPSQAVDSESDGVEEETTEGEEEAEEAAPTGQTFRVKVDGEEVEVPLDELLKGYSRTADYTRKTQAIAEARKQAEAELALARQERQQYAQTLTALDAQLKSLQPPEIDWDRLYQENPVEWVRQRELQRSRQEQAQWVQAQRTALVQKQQAEEQLNAEKTLEVERSKLVEALPDWRNPEKARAEKAKIVEYATGKLGFSVEEISDVYDARAVLALRKAMLYDELMSKRDQMRPKIIQKAKPMRAGVASTPQSSKVVASKAALSRLANSGSTRDAAAVFEQFID